MARIFLLRVGTELDFESVNLQVRELGFASDSEKLYLGTSIGNVNIPTEDAVKDILDAKLVTFDSAYQIWLKNGNTGSEEDFLNSLAGDDGESAYDIWLGLGNTGSEQDFIDSLGGGGSGSGKQAYTLTLTQPVGEGNPYYEVDLGQHDGDEGIVEFMLVEFKSITLDESSSEIIEAGAPESTNGAFYIPASLPPVGEGTEIEVFSANLNSGYLEDRMYRLIHTNTNNVKVRIETNHVDDMAVITLTPKMETTTSIPTLRMVWHQQ